MIFSQLAKPLLKMFVLLSLIVLLAACNGTNTANNNNSGEAAESTTTQLESEEAANEKDQATTRDFEHEFGTTEAPTAPQRIMALYMEDYLVALGLKPITQTVIGNFSLQYLQPYIGDLPKIDSSAVDFEAVLNAQPDLIMLAFPNYAIDGKYELFDKIAPTYVFAADTPDNWREAVKTVGQLTGKVTEADKVLADYDAKTDEARSRLSEKLGNETVALLRIRSNKELRLYGGPGGYAGNVLYTDLGLNPPQIVKELAWGEQSMRVISQEIIPQIDADHLFLTYDEGGKELAQEILESEMWKSLPAVQKNQVYEVSLDHWMTYGPIAYNLKVDDVLQALAP
ncbi:ABC transporter substrate-binding protein [Paenibacillus xylanexedens]|uniref:ABC transporter substrate-binding protein n=1 Tax=Paenibacillus xylanexedens TaxID=528191 RepID=UPI0011A95E88|nr:ABC transporter substrate-binding protein [Paenibacillus xylanexedens]